jgi:type IV pilus assembly protein PilA
LSGIRGEERGFTLVELLVVMIVLGMLAAMAVPIFISQRRKAVEASAKSDVKAIVKDLVASYVDEPGPLNVSGSAGSWTLTRGAVVVARGNLSPGNTVTAASYAASDSDFCVAVLNATVGAQSWVSAGGGLQPGDC